MSTKDNKPVKRKRRKRTATLAGTSQSAFVGSSMTTRVKASEIKASDPQKPPDSESTSKDKQADDD